MLPSLRPQSITAAASTPEQLVDALCRQYPKSASTLRLVHRVCVEHKRSGSRDFTLSKVGELCSAQGGPSGTYLRTTPAKRYCAIIKAVEATCHSKLGSKRAGGSDIDAVLEGLPDPTVRARVGILLAELTSLRREKRGFGDFAATARRPVPVPVPAAGPSSAAPSASEALQEPPVLSALQRLALEQAIDPQRLREQGWRADKNGRVVVEKTGTTIFAAGFVSAIEMVLAPRG